MNHVSVIGNLGADPELRFTPQGDAVCNFSLAVSRRYQVGGDWKEETDWIRVQAWKNLAENIAESLVKGNRVIVVGRFKQRDWEDQHGTKHNAVELQAESVGPSLQWATVKDIVANPRSGQ